MSYLRKIEYEIVLKDSFLIIRNCPKCGRKSHYINTKKMYKDMNDDEEKLYRFYEIRDGIRWNFAAYTSKNRLTIFENMVLYY